MQRGSVVTERADLPESDVAIKERLRAILAKFWSTYRARAFRSVVGLALLAWTGDVTRRHVIMAESLEAVVITDTVVVTAPIEGIVKRGDDDLGRMLDKGAPLVTIANPLVDASAHEETKAKITALDGDLKSLSWQIGQLEKLNQTLASRGQQFQVKRTRQLELLSEEVKAEVSANQARQREAEARKARAAAMVQEGVAPQRELDEAERDYEVAKEAEVASARKLDSTNAMLDALQDGLSLGDFSSADKSYSGQRQDEVAVALTRLRAEADTKTALRDALAVQLTTQLAQYNLHAAAPIVAQQRSHLLSWDVGDGTYVQRGAKLARLADCSRFRVIAYVSERSYNRLRIGDRADVKIGFDDATYQGRVEMLLGPPEARVEAQSAVGLPIENRNRYAVVVESEDLARVYSKSCNAGQSAEVNFNPSRPFWG